MSEPEMELEEDWKHIVASYPHKGKMADVCDVSYATVRRWGLPYRMSDSAVPQPSKIVLLAKMGVPGLEKALQNAFPHVFEVPDEPGVLTIPIEYVLEIVGLRANSNEYVSTYTIHNTIYQNIASQLDPRGDGFLSLFVECVRPDNEKGLMTHLLAHDGFGTNTDLWSIQQLRQEAFFSRETLCARAIGISNSFTAAGPVFYPHNLAPEIEEHFLHAEHIASAGAFPVTLFGRRVAGVLFTASVHAGFFTQPKRALLRHYANMLGLGLNDAQFYPFDRIQLE